MSNIFRGENVDQELPVITITDGNTTLVIDPSLNTAGNEGTAGVIPVDHYRIVKHNHLTTDKGLDAYPVFEAPVTITMAPAAGTQVHYTFNARNPTSKAVKKAFTGDSYQTQYNTNHYRMGAARVYEAPIDVEDGRPGSDLTTIRVRAYKLDANGQYGIDPNVKSQVLIARFTLIVYHPEGNGHY